VENISFREQQFKVREHAIIDSANRLMAQKGYDLMTMDDVAADVGISKGIIYKHFESKESLAAAAMIRLLDEAIAQFAAMPAELPPRQRLESALGWALRRRLEGGLPLLPATSPSLQRSLMANGAYLARLFQLNAQVTALVDRARADGTLRSDIPADVIVHTIYARTCDPAFDFLRDSGRHSPDDLINYLVATSFDGLGAASAP
jgi:AcrR family transcriptional regulator